MEVNSDYTCGTVFVLTAVAILFQLALTLGTTWGASTLGGKYPGQLPPKIRLVALGYILILLLFGAIVLARSGSALNAIFPFSCVAIWYVASFFVLGSIAKLATPNRGEGLRWRPVNVITLLVTNLIALSL